MADEPKAGTPDGSVADGGNAGTTTAPKDGGLMDGLTPDQKALFLAQEKKAEEGNKALERANRAEAQLMAIQQQQYAQQQGANPLAEMVNELQQAAQYDVNSRASLAALQIQATQQAEMETLRAMMRAGVPPAMQDTVAQIVRQSGYRASVEQAVQMARGAEVPDLALQLRAKDEELRRLRETLDARTVGNGAPKGNPAATGSAAGAADSGDLEVTLDEYVKLPLDQRSRARIKR